MSATTKWLRTAARAAAWTFIAGIVMVATFRWLEARAFKGMIAFFDWLASLGWGASLCFSLAFGVGGCIIILLIDFAVRSHEERRELRAIKNRLWEARKKKLLDAFEGPNKKHMQRRLDDAQFLRLLEIDTANDAAQGIRERNQFHLPAAFRDFKGVQK